MRGHDPPTFGMADPGLALPSDRRSADAQKLNIDRAEIAAEAGDRGPDHLSGFPMVLPDETMMVRSVIDSVFQRLKVTLRPEMESNSIEMVRGFVASGQGISFLNQININDERTQGTIVFLPIIGKFPPLNLKIVRRAGDRQIIPGLLANAIRDAVGDLEPGGKIRL